jgi:hypothetical protein
MLHHVSCAKAIKNDGSYDKNRALLSLGLFLTRFGYNLAISGYIWLP